MFGRLKKVLRAPTCTVAFFILDLTSVSSYRSGGYYCAEVEESVSKGDEAISNVKRSGKSVVWIGVGGNGIGAGVGRVVGR